MQKTSTSTDVGLELIRVVTTEGEERYYSLFLEYAEKKSANPAKSLGRRLAESTELFLAWDYEKFYAEEDESGRVKYPVEIPVTSLVNPEKKGF